MRIRDLTLCLLAVTGFACNGDDSKSESGTTETSGDGDPSGGDGDGDPGDGDGDGDSGDGDGDPGDGDGDSGDGDGDPGDGHPVGTRCETAGDCDVGLICLSDFFFERRVCTKSCETDTDCAAPAVCVEEVPDYNGGLIGPYCLRPCEMQADCEATLGSDCDTHDPLGGARYCF